MGRQWLRKKTQFIFQKKEDSAACHAYEPEPVTQKARVQHSLMLLEFGQQSHDEQEHQTHTNELLFLLVKLIHILMLEIYFVNKIYLIIYVYENATNSSSLLWCDLLFQNNFTCYFAASPPRYFVQGPPLHG